MSLRPISSCCGAYLVAKIGTEIAVCEKCNTEYEIEKSTKISTSSKCPICRDYLDGSSGYIRCRWENRADNTYFNGIVCDPCWDNIIMPLLRAKHNSKCYCLVCEIKRKHSSICNCTLCEIKRGSK